MIVRRYTAEVGALCLVAISCAPGTPITGSPDHGAASARLAEVRTEDGVSRSEAEAIAWYFFQYHANVDAAPPIS
jgi:hypothetical protein